MRQITVPNSLYKKLVNLSNDVKQALIQRGLAVPVENLDGSITIGYNTIVKRKDFLVILDFSGEVLIDKINLPQTAILLANDLALGKSINSQLLQIDRKYGYAAFEEALHIHLAERITSKDPDQADIMIAKSRIDLQQKIYYKKQIMDRYEKLRRIA